MADTATILADPKFQSLPPEERIKVLNSVDANFMKLADSEKMKVVTSPRLGTSSRGATGSWEAPATGVLDKPWVSPTNPLYPIAEGAREGLTQATNVGQGVTEAITQIPGMIHSASKPLLQLSHGDVRGAAGSAADIGRGMVQPAVTIGREAGALVAPGSIDAPTQEEQDAASHGAGQLGGSLLLPDAAGAVADPIKRATSVEAMQDLAARLRMARDKGPNTTTGVIGAATGATVGYKAGGYPGSLAGGVIGGAVGRSAVPALAGAAASTLDRAAQIRLRMGATPRGATYAPMNPVLDATEQARQSLHAEQPRIESTRNPNAGFQERFTPEELTAKASDNGAAGPQGEFSKFPQDPDSPQYQAINDATANQALGIVEPETVGTQSAVPQAETAVQPQAPAVEPAIPPNVRSVATKLVRRGLGSNSFDDAITMSQKLLRILPDIDRLSDVPDASDISPFDRVLNHELENTGHKIGAKLDSVKDKYISTGAAKEELEGLMTQARESDDTASALKIKKLIDLFDESAISPGSQVNAIRQGLFKSKMNMTSGIGSAVYDVFRGLTEKLDPEFKDLNDRYYVLKSSAEFADLRLGGKSPESQVGAGLRPNADFKEKMKAQADAEAAAVKQKRIDEIRADRAKKGEAKKAEKAVDQAKKDAVKKARDAEKAAASKKAEELRRREKMDAAARAARDRGFRGGPL